MRTRWHNLRLLSTIDEAWDEIPSAAGIYIVRRSEPTQRIGGWDRYGTLYVGKARVLRNRLWSFLRANHTASGFLWVHRAMARLVLAKPIRTVRDVEKNLGKLTVRYAAPVSIRDLQRAERAALFAYISKFGEAPPLNLSLTKRWDATPSAQELRWAEDGVFGGG